MKLRNTAIALGVGAATAAGLSLLKVNKDLVVGSTAIVVGAGLMIALNNKNDINFKARNYPQLLNDLEQEEWFEIVQSRIQNGENGFLSIDSFERSLNHLKETQPDRKNLWKELEDYAHSFA